jgi:hypothetical protein
MRVLSWRAQALALANPLFGPNFSITRADQIALTLTYRSHLQKGERLSFDDVGFRVFSQHDEDGILLYILAAIGMGRRRSVEIGTGDATECNTANLLLNHGWHGLLVDGNAAALRRAARFFHLAKDTTTFPPVLRPAAVTAEGVNDLIRDAGFDGEVDLLSLDIDGVDWWVWKALDCVRPRVVIVETPTIWGPDRAVTVPYDAGFRRSPRHPDFYGASLAAYVKLGREKRMRLVGVSKYGTNAFFVRGDLAEDKLPTVDAADCFNHPRAQDGIATRWKSVQHLPWQEV